MASWWTFHNAIISSLMFEKSEIVRSAGKETFRDAENEPGEMWLACCLRR